MARMRKAVAALALPGALAAAGGPAAPPNDLEHNRRRQTELIAFNPRYVQMKAERTAKVRALTEEVARREAAREDTTCSHDILFELRLQLFPPAVFAAIDRRIRDVEATLADPKREALAEKQNPEDGSF